MAWSVEPRPSDADEHAKGSAKELAAEELKWLTSWATNWDKRVVVEGWVCWAWCLYFQACREEGPESSERRARG